LSRSVGAARSIDTRIQALDSHQFLEVVHQQSRLKTGAVSLPMETHPRRAEFFALPAPPSQICQAAFEI
jgi:hypothetical protein